MSGNREALKETLSTALTLLVFSVVCAGLLAGTYLATLPRIDAAVQAEKRQLLAQTLPMGGFDNNLVEDARPLAPSPLLGLRRPGQAYLATHRGQPIGVVLESVAPDGYAGEIRLLVGILADGRIAGVRVTTHKETPGLGDYIEAEKSSWIHQFQGKSLEAPDETGWQVRKDGGRFDYMAGATITPRAVVAAVHKSLRYFQQHRQTLLALPPSKDKP